MKIIETERLILRTWKEEDTKPYFDINQDPKVIEFLWGPLTLEQVTDFISVQNKQQEQRGYTLWAVELKSTHALMGFIGLKYTDWEAHFTPAVEVGWRLGSQYWGNGYATEGAKAAVEYGFNKIGLTEIVSFSVPANIKSIKVMERIGMQRDLEGDFVRPNVTIDSPLLLHILYRINNGNGIVI